jgi:hypothetical protein
MQLRKPVIATQRKFGYPITPGTAFTKLFQENASPPEGGQGLTWAVLIGSRRPKSAPMPIVLAAPVSGTRGTSNPSTVTCLPCGRGARKQSWRAAWTVRTVGVVPLPPGADGAVPPAQAVPTALPSTVNRPVSRLTNMSTRNSRMVISLLRTAPAGHTRRRFEVERAAMTWLTRGPKVYASAPCVIRYRDRLQNTSHSGAAPPSRLLAELRCRASPGPQGEPPGCRVAPGRERHGTIVGSDG